MENLIAKHIVGQYDLEEYSDILTIKTHKDSLLDVMNSLKNNKELDFAQLTDLCAIDYQTYGETEWGTKEVTSTGYSRGIKPSSHGRIKFNDKVPQNKMENRFCVAYHLLSISNNNRIRVKVYLNDEPPIIKSITSLWPAADWYEREAFDLFGILFEGHPDLRRLLSDYGFIGHPFRKDFPLIGNTQIRYDPNLKRIIQEPVSITPRVLVPKVIREEK
jgi:NADH-quinone oxidoreductase subunit C